MGLKAIAAPLLACAWLAAAGCLEEEAPAPEPVRPTITVASAGQLREALGSDRIIEVLDVPILLPGRGERDGPLACLDLSGLSNLTIAGLGRGPVVLQTDRDEALVFAKGARNVALVNLEIKHLVEGQCASDCVVLVACEKVVVDRCVLLGCGITGLAALECADVEVSGTRISECSEPVWLRGSRNVRLRDCEISGNRSAIVLNCEKSEGVLLERCRIRNNPAGGKTGRHDLFWVRGGGTVAVRGGEIVGNRAEYLLSDEGAVRFEDVALDANEFEEGRFRRPRSDASEPKEAR